ncbi:MAG: DNA primase, partial [Actinobacteria bacterium]|nr:DNA primase [Actinomycetota bacterium]
MAGRIRDEDIEAVRERTDLAKVVSGYLTLKKTGHDSLSGLCPFHSEKSASFSVSPSKQVYYCFGCGAGGDAVRFLQEMESLTFVETIERLAKDVGITLRYEGESAAEKKAAGRRGALHRANEEASHEFQQALFELAEAEEARNYLDSRGIDRAAAERFGMGYAPRQADYLLRKMSKKVSSDLLVEAGLVSSGEAGMRDRFRGRITFPIRDLSGRYVGFGARILPSADAKGQKQAKYLNTSESPVYRKGELLYNLDAAKSSITRTGEVVIVEGYTDVISLALAGVDNSVATCGTALTESHLRTLSRFAQRAVLTFDADEAGARAAERAFAFHESSAIHPFVLILPDGQDPSDFAQIHGGEAFKTLASGARPLVEFMIRRTVERIDLSTVEGRTAAVDAGFPIIEGLTDPVRKQ